MPNNLNPIYRKYFPELTNEQEIQLNEFKDLLLDWNNRINVISRKDTEHFEVRHVLHSLAIAKFLQFKPNTEILDFGTGGGFPGLPLAIFFPDSNFTLVDSIGKKVKVAHECAQSLNLKNVTCIHTRVEDIEEKFDFVTCRAVGRIGKILPWVKKSLTKESRNNISNGYLFLKGGELEEELRETNLKSQRIPISQYFSDPFFETKEIVYLSPFKI